MIDRRKDSLLRIKQVRQRTGMSRATIDRREAAGAFPRRIKMGPKMVGWYESDINEVVANPAGYRAPTAGPAPSAG